VVPVTRWCDGARAAVTLPSMQKYTAGCYCCLQLLCAFGTWTASRLQSSSQLFTWCCHT
jgi:hypothetical protein